MSNSSSKTVTPTEIRLAVEWLAANANGVSLIDWEPRSQTLLTAADQIEAMASVGIRQERRIERLTHELAVQKMIEDAMTDCIQLHEGQTFEERAEELIVTEVQHQQCPAVETTRDDAAFEAGWRAAAEWAKRDDLVHDIDSPAYRIDRFNRLKRLAVEPSVPNAHCNGCGQDYVATKGHVCPAVKAPARHQWTPRTSGGFDCYGCGSFAINERACREIESDSDCRALNGSAESTK